MDEKELMVLADWLRRKGYKLSIEYDNGGGECVVRAIDSYDVAIAERASSISDGVRKLAARLIEWDWKKLECIVEEME